MPSIESVIRITLGAIAAAAIGALAWFVLPVLFTILMALLAAALGGYAAATKGYDLAVAGTARLAGWFNARRAAATPTNA